MPAANQGWGEGQKPRDYLGVKCKLRAVSVRGWALGSPSPPRPFPSSKTKRPSRPAPRLPRVPSRALQIAGAPPLSSPLFPEEGRRRRGADRMTRHLPGQGRGRGRSPSSPAFGTARPPLVSFDQRTFIHPLSLWPARRGVGCSFLGHPRCTPGSGQVQGIPPRSWMSYPAAAPSYSLRPWVGHGPLPTPQLDCPTWQLLETRGHSEAEHTAALRVCGVAPHPTAVLSGLFPAPTLPGLNSPPPPPPSGKVAPTLNLRG